MENKEINLCEILKDCLKWKQQIPYNSDTAHLVGTNDDAPEYYKWWEE